MSKKSRPRFHVREGNRVHDGKVMLALAVSPAAAHRIKYALEQEAEQPKTLPPSPSSVDGLPEIPDGHTRVTVDCLEGTEIRVSREHAEHSWLGTTPISVQTSEVTTINGPVILRRLVQRGKRA